MLSLIRGTCENLARPNHWTFKIKGGYKVKDALIYVHRYLQKRIVFMLFTSGLVPRSLMPQPRWFRSDYEKLYPALGFFRCQKRRTSRRT